tara:strand:- start:2271 stop:3074 length:804 start_codon:yes stop_codon:yes gene_type:complete
MGTNREIKSDGNVIIKGFTYPSSDGTNGQVLTTNGSGVFSFSDIAASGVRVVTLSNQTEANAYSTQENDFVKITGDVSLTSKTLVNVDFVLDSQTRTLTIDKGSATGCSFLGGVVVLKADSSHSSDPVQTSGLNTLAISSCELNCHKVDILQALASTQGRVDIQVKDTFINCSEYRYLVTYTSLSQDGDGNNTAAACAFDNVQIMAVTQGTISGSQLAATAAFTDVIVTSVITLPTQRMLAEEHLGSGDDFETGSKTNCRQITLTSL